MNAESRALPRLAGTGLLLLLSAGVLHAQTFQVIHSFTGGADGLEPESGLTLDAAGNLYGTAYYGGNTGTNCDGSCGTDFKMKHSGEGWVLTPLYAFNGGSDGSHPAANVTVGPDGTIYGTTVNGGVSCPSSTQEGCGTVFNLRPRPTFCNTAVCLWTETVLYRFAGGQNDGAIPIANVTFDQSGNLYGTTFEGGTYTSNCYYGDDWCGTVFELARSNGSWSESLPYIFTGGDDGAVPEAGLTLDGSGNLYGTTLSNGALGEGTVFELTPSGSNWVLNTVHSFNGADGEFPRGNLIFDPAGNLYGTTQFGGGSDGGVVFELNPSGGSWSFNLLYALQARVEQNGPLAGVTRDSAGNLYGTAYSLGPGNVGLVFELSPTEGGWTYTVLHMFTDTGDGALPMGGVTLGADGNLYGTASTGGAHGMGVVWEITP